MRYKLLGRSGLRVSELGFGAMTFGEEWGWGASKEESKRLFDTYAGAGGNFLDTANRYTEGTSERYLGEFISADREHFANQRAELYYTVKRELERLSGPLENLIDVQLQKEIGNTQAAGYLMTFDMMVPVTFLLALEKRLASVIKLLEEIPEEQKADSKMSREEYLKHTKVSSQDLFEIAKKMKK